VVVDRKIDGADMVKIVLSIEAHLRGGNSTLLRTQRLERIGPVIPSHSQLFNDGAATQVGDRGRQLNGAEGLMVACSCLSPSISDDFFERLQS
jgi:hypothetical protein